MTVVTETLPPAPSDQSAWPWGADGAAPAADASVVWPKITVVTPSYNQGQFLEQTIRSVLLQGYPNLEYIVIDGGSDDQSVEILRKYDPWIDYWVSEADRGQSHAINKGFERATGDVLAWLNSDDQFAPGSLATVGRRFAEDNDCQWLIGAAAHRRLDNGKETVCPAHLASETALIEFWRFGEPGYYVKQPSVFWRRGLWEAVGGLEEQLHLAMDHDLWLKFDEHAPAVTIDELLSLAILHEDCKSLCSGRLQASETIQRCYAAARRRGRSKSWLTWQFLKAAPGWRISRLVKNIRLRWWGGVVRELIGAVMDPARVWSESGRLTAIRGRD